MSQAPAPPGDRSAGRLPELDALRGLAALAVMSIHFYLVWLFLHPVPPRWVSYLLLLSPVRLLLTGKTTLLFFVLSGLVLSYPHFHGRAPRYAAFVLKRLLRLYLPYLVALAFTLDLMRLAAEPGALAHMPGFARMWAAAPSPQAVLEHVALVGPFDAKTIDPPIWSLVHELRLSLALPLIVLLVMRLHWVAALGVGLGFALGGAWLMEAFPTPLESWYKTSQFVLMFVLGALLARHLAALREGYARLGAAARAALFAAGTAAFAYSSFVFGPEHLDSPFLANAGASLGGAALVALALCSPRLSRAMRAPALAALGKLPYGIYLYHLPVTFALMRWGYPQWSFPAIAAAAVAATFGLAWLSYRFVEQPTARLAAQLSKRLSGRRAEPVPLPEAA
jgi:peptidoglycan/LPS O-acetylase OafA/YrhL